MNQPTIKSMAEIEEEYRAMLMRSDELSLDLGDWLPELREHVRPIAPGELVFIMGDTGAGKSMACQGIAADAAPGSVLYFSLELPNTLMFERFAALTTDRECWRIEKAVRAGQSIPKSGLDHIWSCDATRLSKDQMATLINEDAVKLMGHKPSTVMVDYLGLMGASGKSRYERASCAAEDLKVLAKECNVVVVAATQIHRQSEDIEVDIHSAKDSGSIENSAGLLLGLWRDATDLGKLYVRICKNTKGQAGKVIECRIDGAKMRISPWQSTDTVPLARDMAHFDG